MPLSSTDLTPFVKDWECTILGVLCACDRLLCSLQSHLDSIQNPEKNRNQKTTKTHAPQGGELGPVMFFYFFSFFGFMIFGLLVSWFSGSLFAFFEGLAKQHKSGRT